MCLTAPPTSLWPWQPLWVTARDTGCIWRTWAFAMTAERRMDRYAPSSLGSVQMCCLFKITQRSRPSFVNPFVSSCMMTSLNQEPVIRAPCTQFDWRPVPLLVCTHLLDSSFLHHPSFLKNPKVPPPCYTWVLGRPPLLAPTLKRRAVFAERLAMLLIYFKALANMS